MADHLSYHPLLCCKNSHQYGGARFYSRTVALIRGPAVVVFVKFHAFSRLVLFLHPRLPLKSQTVLINNSREELYIPSLSIRTGDWKIVWGKTRKIFPSGTKLDKTWKNRRHCSILTPWLLSSMPDRVRPVLWGITGGMRFSVHGPAPRSCSPGAWSLSGFSSVRSVLIIMILMTISQFLHPSANSINILFSV